MGCGSILRVNFDNSSYSMLKTIYPAHTWVPWKFKKLPISALSDPEVVKSCLEYVEKEKGIKDMDGWYTITYEDLRKLGVYAIFSRHGGLYQVLKQFRPGFPWEEDLFTGGKLIGKKSLVASLRKIFPKVEVVEDHRISDTLRVTAFLPSLKLALRYQEMMYPPVDSPILI